MTMKTRPPLLEANTVPVPGQRYTLAESFFQTFQVVKDPYIVETVVNESARQSELVEKRVSEGPMVIRGVFQREGVKNANGRVYPRGLWEKHLRADAPLMRKVSERMCTGQIEHPERGSGSLREAAILVTKLDLSTHEDTDGGRTLIGEAEVLDTPDGRIVRDLIRNRVKIGVSSRGTGTVNTRGEVEEKTYTPETWDVVGNPSTPGAFPTVIENPPHGVHESAGSSHTHRVQCMCDGGRMTWRVIDEQTDQVVRQYTAGVSKVSEKKSGETIMPRFDSIRQHCNVLLATNADDLTESKIVALDGSLAQTSIDLNGVLAEDATLKNVIDDLQKRISEKRSDLSYLLETDTADDEAADDEAVSEGAESATKDGPTLEEAHALIEEAADYIESQGLQLKAEKRLNNTLTEKLADAEKEIATLTETVSTQQDMIAKLTEKRDTSVEDAVAEAIATNKTLETIRPLLERCENAAEVAAAVANFRPSASRVDKTEESLLPPAGSTVMSSSKSQRVNESAIEESTKSGDMSEGAKLINTLLNRRYPKATQVQEAAAPAQA